MKTCLITILLIVSKNLVAQEINCAQIYSEEIMEISRTPEFPARPESGFDAYFKFLKEKTETSSIKGKVYVKFVVDTTGDVQCIKVIKTDNALLNDKATTFIKEAKFTPAEERGKKVVSIMILPITFGPEPSREKQQKNKGKDKN